MDALLLGRYAMVSLTLIALAAMTLLPIDTLDAETLLVRFDESGEEAAEIQELLDERRRRPLDLNSCSADDLLDFPFVTAAEANAIVDHRRDRGPFPSLDSLHTVDDLDAATLERLLPFVTAHPPSHARLRPSIRAELIQRWTRKLERADGFRRDSSGYLGSPDVLQTRLRLGLGKLSARATFDKDAGEPMRWDMRSRSLGFDFMSGHVQIENIGWFQRIVVGDFSPRFAHGVLLRAPGNVRGNAPSGRGGSASLRPYASAAENGHFRGIGLQIAPGRRLAFTAFASKRRIDAGIDTTSGAANPVVSRKSSGLHRTVTERSGRGALQEAMVGGTVRAAVGPISLAAAIFASEERLEAPFAPPTSLSRRVSGSSFSGGASFGSLYLAAEWAPRTGLSTSIDIRSGRHSRFGMSVRGAGNAVYRPTSALAAGSHGFTDPSTDISLHGRHKFSGTTVIEFDLRHAFRSAPNDRRPFATIRSAADVLLYHAPKPWLTMTFRGTQRRGDDMAFCAGGTVRCLSTSRRHTLRFQVDYRHSRHLECRLRAEVVRAGMQHPASHLMDGEAERHEASRGLLLYEEVRIRPTDALLIAGRLAVFSTDRHLARIYTYETDLAYAFSSPSFAGRGRRSYAFVRWKTARAIMLEAKWSLTMMEDVESIGSGRDEIGGARLREIRLQIRMSFE